MDECVFVFVSVEVEISVVGGGGEGGGGRRGRGGNSRSNIWEEGCMCVNVCDLEWMERGKTACM